MIYVIYQAPRDAVRNHFRQYSADRKVSREHYVETYRGEIAGVNDQSALEMLFHKFNTRHPKDFKSYSLSAEDVIVLDGERIYYCDVVGWQKVPADQIEGTFV